MGASPVVDAFRDGRAAERGFVRYVAKLDEWGAEQWCARIAELARQVELRQMIGDDLLRVPYLYGRLSIVLDQTEGTSS